MTRSASPGSAAPGGTKSRSTSGSAASGSKSSKLAMRGSRGTAILIAPQAPGATRCVEPEDVLGGQATRVLELRHDAEARQPVARPDDGDAVVEQARIAAELVDDVARQPRPLLLLQQLPGPDQRWR